MEVDSDGDGGSEAEDNDFTVVCEPTLAAGVRAAAWNPVMDLLALALSDGQLLIQRHTWQRWLQIPPALAGTGADDEITAVGWHPDGKTLVLGRSNGIIQLCSVEDGGELHSEKLHDAPVTCLHWMVANDTDAVNYTISDCLHLPHLFLSKSTGLHVLFVLLSCLTPRMRRCAAISRRSLQTAVPSTAVFTSKC